MLLKDPEEQWTWRKEYVKSISEVPGPEPLTLIADEMQKYCFESIQDLSKPDK